jgi:hypothetical protein
VRRIVAGLSLAMAATACGGDGADPADATGPVGSTITSASEPAVAAPTEDLVPITSSTAAAAVTDPPGDVLGRELVGRWAHYDIVAYEDGVLKTLIISYGFNDFSIDNGQIVDTAQFCFSEQRTDQPIETSLSDAATQAIKPPSTPVEVDVVDGVLRIRRPVTPTPVGIRLDDPANESLPTDPEDPRIVDDDGDGNPGITVTIRVSDDLTGELYIARREIFAYEAFLVEPDLISGTVTDDSEQLVIGASDPVFAGSGSDWVQHRDLTKSPIILRRVEPDWDCDRLVAERDALFPPTPDVDW